MKIYRILTVLALSSIVFASCDKALDKATIDSTYYNSANLPTVSLTGATLDPVRGQSAVCTATATTTGKFIEAGFMYSTSPDFSDPTTVTVDLPSTTGTINFEATLNFSPLNKFYVVAYATVGEGTTLSKEQKEFSTPDIPLKEKVIGTYSAGTMADYWGDSFKHEITVLEKNDTIWVGNLDPYFVKNEFVYTKGVNIFPVVLDEEKYTMTIESGSKIGYKTCYALGFDNPDPDAAEGYADIVFKVNTAGTVLTVDNGWGICSSTGWWTIYPGGYDYKKK